MVVLTSFSKFVEGLPIQGTLKYTEHFSGPNRSRVENLKGGVQSSIDCNVHLTLQMVWRNVRVKNISVQAAAPALCDK